MLIDITLSIAVFLFVYPFLLYPGVLCLLRPWILPPRRERMEEIELPELAMIICAFNEERIIRDKLENCLALDYPRSKLWIFVISDGSTDRTADIVAEYAGHGIGLIYRKRRLGKTASLNEVLPTLPQEIFFLSDANVIYRSDALLRLVKEFRDPTVGCVSGRVVLTDTAFEKTTEDYYSIEWFLQEAASAMYSMVGADGAMYALRRSLFRSCPNDTIIEDFVIPMSVIRQGKRVVFEPNAVGWEEGSRSLCEEFRRKVRIAAGSVQGLLRGNAWPGWAPPRFWFVFLSHKFLRWLSPVLGALILVIALTSINRPFSQIVVTGFGLIAVMAFLRLITGFRHSIFELPFYFLFSQVAITYGIWKGVRGCQSVLWAKADR